MTINQLQLLFKNRKMVPTSVAHRHNGSTTLMWHVDNNDDRYVLVSSSVESEDFLLVARDDRKVEALVETDGEHVMRWVSEQLHKISSTSKLSKLPL